MPRAACWGLSPTTPSRRSASSCRKRSSRISRPAWRACATRSSGWRSGWAALARLARLLRIFSIGLRFGLHEYIPKYSRNWLLRLLARRQHEPRGRRLREALETLGPIYVKFGQVLSTRRDLIPLDIAEDR